MFKVETSLYRLKIIALIATEISAVASTDPKWNWIDKNEVGKSCGVCGPVVVVIGQVNG